MASGKVTIDSYKNAFSKSPTNLSSYITTTQTYFSAPKTGWYYLFANSGNYYEDPYAELGIQNGYIFREHGVKDYYRYITTPLIYIRQGQQMAARVKENNTGLLYCMED